MAKSASLPAVPTNFIGFKDIDNLSLAGIGVWLICVVVQSFFPSLNSYWLRFIALLVSLCWSLVQFAKNKQWNNGASYLIIAINTCLIFVSASGMNSITRQNPFSGEKVNSNLDTIKSRTILQSGILNLKKQADWFPDYEMISFIDTLKYEITLRDNSIINYKNLFSYFKDDIMTNTNDQKILEIVRKFNLQDESDSSYLKKIKDSYQRKIDSLQRVITQKELQTLYTQTESVEFEGRKMNFNEFVLRTYKKMDSLQDVGRRSRDILDFIKRTKQIPANIDSL